jgi:hypothetical protein
MTVEIRQAGEQWSVEVLGASIGMAETQSEAQQLADYWQARMNSVARWRGHTRAKGPLQLPAWLARVLNLKR